MRLLSVLFSALFIHATLFAQEISVDNIKKHINYLASPQLEGRSPGTNGESLAIAYIEKEFKAIGLKPKGEKGYRQPFTYKKTANPHETNPDAGSTSNGTNVVGFLDNGAENTIVIGGHFDHLGKGHSSSALDQTEGIHYGADDNASGTAGVIELARYYAKNNRKEKYNYLFICFSAEEDGLIGSKHYSNNPTIDLSKVQFMLNMDMIGRLNDSTNKLMIYGVGTSPDFKDVFQNTSGFNIVYDSSGVGPSDHTSFYLKNIPVLHFFTGIHTDYHKETDTPDKINWTGEKKVLEYITQIIDKMDSKPKIAFSQTKQKEQEKVSFKVTLGVMPDYGFEGSGLRIDGVIDGRPAQKAGMQAGDIIKAFDQHTVKDIYEYMNCLAVYKKGEKAKIKVMRGEQEMFFDVEF